MQTETMVTTQTSAVTSTKLAVATLAAFAAAAAAFIVTPAPGQPDMSFPVPPSYATSTITMTWGNTGSADAVFPANKIIYTITAVDANGARVNGSIMVSGTSYGNPYYGTSSNNGTGFWSVAAGKTFKSVYKNVKLPAGTANLIFWQDPTNLVAESNEMNNKYSAYIMPVAQAGSIKVTKNPLLFDRNAQNPTGAEGDTQKLVGSLVVTAGPEENVTLTHVVLRDDVANTCIGSYLQNITLRNSQNVQLGPAYANPSVACVVQNTYVMQLVPAVSIPKGGQYTIDVYADLKAGYTAGASLIDVQHVLATGQSSGSSIDATLLNLSLQSVYIVPVGAQPRTQLNLMWAGDTPSGAASPSSNQVVGKFIITNGGAFDATVKLANIRLESTKIFNGDKVMRIYVNSLASTPVASTTYKGGTLVTGFSAMLDANFDDVIISPGMSKTFIVTFDTSEMQATNALSVLVSPSQILWTDGLLNNLTMSGSDLTTKTFTY